MSMLPANEVNRLTQLSGVLQKGQPEVAPNSSTRAVGKSQGPSGRCETLDRTQAGVVTMKSSHGKSNVPATIEVGPAAVEMPVTRVNCDAGYRQT